ncbi:hypothetical protein [Roseibacillus persicicus]|uniref:hypothetical protein n=1 Tax=Roseibacillus persicicus TaxID=454148 RepID=UPI00280C6AA5|nr:hypothetical protein [Roseibacillus persicicus]MDQ8189429.1 hypothetical protein [Roseibacillus persicicus]
MPSPTEHRLYDLILEKVLRDEEEERIRKRLAINNVPDDEAEAIFQSARKERVRTIRAESRNHLLIGVLLLAGAYCIFLSLWVQLSFQNNTVLVVVGSLVVLGTWQFLQGALGWLIAPRKRGSYLDESSVDYD